MFQRRHFAKLAELINKAQASMEPEAFNEYVQEWTANLAGTNPNFNRSRFIAACMGNPTGRDKAAVRRSFN